MIRRLATIAAVAMLATAIQVAPGIAAEPGSTVPLEAIVKLDAAGAIDLAALQIEMDAASIEPLLPSRGIFKVRSHFTITYKDDGKAKVEGDAKKWLKERIEKNERVLWFETELEFDVGDDRIHAWPQSLPTAASEAALLSQPAFAALELESAHTYGTGEGIVIAVLDTGVDASHPLLAGRLVAGYDLVDDDADPTDEVNGADDDGDGHYDEAYGHGTFIAGIVAQVAPDALVQPIRVLDADGRAEFYAVIEAIDYAIESGADVINMSFGIPARFQSKAFDAALKRAHAAGIVVVAAAGNSGVSDEHYPAAAKDVISVTALGPDDQLLAPFSNHGKWVHIAAPGVDIVSAVPGGGYATWSGTSMATPVVSSLAAILEDYVPEKAGKKTAKAILDGARKMEAKERAEKGVIDVLGSIEKIG